MATGQTLLDTMEVLDQELQLQTGESDVSRGLLALNRAQDVLETLVAEEPDLLGDTKGTVTTTASTETTAFPSSLLRLDSLWLLDATTSLPVYQLNNFRNPPARRYAWPASLAATANAGAPAGYWTDGSVIYWTPLPDATYTVRWYGFSAAADITASGTFTYRDICILPLASVAVALMKAGVGDELSDVNSFAQTTLRPVVRAMARFNRDGGGAFRYTRFHTT